MKDPLLIPMLTERLLAISENSSGYADLNDLCIDWFDTLHSSGVELNDLLQAVPESHVSRGKHLHDEIIWAASQALTDERQTHLRQHMAAILAFLTERPNSGFRLASNLVHGHPASTLDAICRRIQHFDIPFGALKPKLRVAFLDSFAKPTACENAEPTTALSLINLLFDNARLSGVFARRMLDHLTEAVFQSYASLAFKSASGVDSSISVQHINLVFEYLDGLKVRPDLEGTDNIVSALIASSNRQPGQQFPDPTRHAQVLEHLLDRMDEMNIPWRENVRHELEQMAPDTLPGAIVEPRLLAAAAHSLMADASNGLPGYLMAATIIKKAPLEDILRLHAKDPEALCAIHTVRPDSTFLPLMTPLHRRQVLSQDLAI